MYTNIDSRDIPLHWINLRRATSRRNRMMWALRTGSWRGERWDAIDAQSSNHIFIPYRKYLNIDNTLPGIQRINEEDPSRSTSRSELACLCSWVQLIESLKFKSSPTRWYLLMEDDVGSSLAAHEHWPFSLKDIIAQASQEVLAIQLAPINGRAKQYLYKEWKDSSGDKLITSKNRIKAHGNGAVLLHELAIPILSRNLGRLIEKITPNIHFIPHPYAVRPVADKWLYSLLPKNSCWVSTFPLFCLDAKNSYLHSEHVKTFHQASKNVTLEIWHKENRKNMINCQKEWSSIN